MTLIPRVGMSDAEITAAIAARPECRWCGKKHSPKFFHAGQCTVLVDGMYCPNRAIRYGGIPSLFCKAHGVER